MTLSGSSTSFTYDANGNVTSDGTRTFTWDAEDRLVSVTIGTHVTTFNYDGLSRRVEIIEADNGSTTSDTKFIWCVLALCEARNSGGTVLKRYFDQGVQDAGASYFYTRDHLGSVRELVDSSNTVRARYDYDAWGRRTKINGDRDADAGFTGHWQHGPSGLLLAPFRAYDPNLGRWISEDPIGRLDGPNMHSYVDNRPVRAMDPLGLQMAPAPDSVTNAIQQAIRHGNAAELQTILDVSGESVPAAWRQAAQEAIKKLQTPAGDLISGSLKRSASYSSELEGETFGDLLNDPSQKAQKMIKLIKQAGRISDKIKQCIK